MLHRQKVQKLNEYRIDSRAVPTQLVKLDRGTSSETWGKFDYKGKKRMIEWGDTEVTGDRSGKGKPTTQTCHGAEVPLPKEHILISLTLTANYVMGEKPITVWDDHCILVLVSSTWKQTNSYLNIEKALQTELNFLISMSQSTTKRKQYVNKDNRSVTCALFCYWKEITFSTNKVY